MLTQKDITIIARMLETQSTDIKKEITRLETKMDLLKEDTTNIIACLDSILLSHDKRVTRVENHLDLPPLKN